MHAPATNAFEASGPSGAVLLWALEISGGFRPGFLDTVRPPVSHAQMKSQPVEAARHWLMEDVSRMTAGQRRRVSRGRSRDHRKSTCSPHDTFAT